MVPSVLTNRKTAVYQLLGGLFGRRPGHHLGIRPHARCPTSPKPGLDRRLPLRSFTPFVGTGPPSSPRRDEAFDYRYEGKQNLRVSIRPAVRNGSRQYSSGSCVLSARL